MLSYSVSSIVTPEMGYYDDYYSLKQINSFYESGFYFNKINALSGLKDCSINNYTSQYLTSKKYLDNVIELKTKPIKPKTFTTRLQFLNIADYSKSRFLYIPLNPNDSSSNIASVRCVLSSEIINSNNQYFELEILNDIFLRIKHSDGNKPYYLNYVSSSNSAYFYSYISETVPLTSERNDMFRYLIDADGYLQLYKNTLSGSKVVVLSSNTIAFSEILSGQSYFNTTSLIKIDYNFTEATPKVYNSWIGYDSKKNNSLTIDESRSVFDLKNQLLLHTNYRDLSVNKLNFLVLNNNRSEKNYIKRGVSRINASPYYPDVDFRDYNTLVTGNDQEKGNDNISLVYTWNDKDIKIKNGMDTTFRAPSSLYPYEKINVNDTKFVSNGALASRSPLVADKIYQLNKQTSTFNNGRYLCTWLSGGSDSPGLWVDRYYYPDLLKKYQELSYPVFGPSFLDPVGDILIVNQNDISAEMFFDKKSDVCITPNSLYKYQRICSSETGLIINTTSPLASGFTEYYDINNRIKPYFSNSINYDGSKYNKFVISDSINSSSSFTISFEIFLDPSIDYGYQILGNWTDKGFGIVSNEQITPVLLVNVGKQVKSYSTTYTLLNTIEFDTEVLDIIREKSLKPYYVICKGGDIYKVNSIGNKILKKNIPSVVGYVSYCISGDYIYLLKSKVTGLAIKIHKNTFDYSTIQCSKIKSWEDNSNIDYIYNGIFVYNEVLYGIPGDSIRYLDKHNIFYLVQGKNLIKHNLKEDKFESYIQSKTKIADFCIGPSNTINLLHENSKVSTFTLNRTLLNNFNLSSFSGFLSGVGINSINEYTQSGKTSDILVTYIDSNNQVNFKRTIDVLPYNTGLSGLQVYNYNSNRPVRYNITNFNYLKSIDEYEGLKFNLTLTNFLSSTDILDISIPFDINSIDRGYHTFLFRFDPIQGNITLFVDGKVYDNISIPPGKYGIQDIFSDDLFVGTAGFYNGVDLATYLRQPGYYYLNNSNVKNLFIYDRPLRDSEVDILNIHEKSIDELVLSIPAGMRNNIEEIERYFKYSGVHASSKKIDIYVKNSNIKDVSIRNEIKQLINNEVYKVLPVGAVINNIHFIDFND